MKKGMALLAAAVLCLGFAVPGRADVEAGKYGYIDAAGSIVIAPEYDYASFFSDGYAAVFKGTLASYGYYPKEGQYGFIDTAGNLIGPMQWEEAGYFKSGLAPVKTGGKYGYIDTTGQIAIQPAYDYAFSFVGGLGRVFKGTLFAYSEWPEKGKYGFIDTAGHVVSSVQWDEANDFYEGLAVVAKNGKYGFIGTDGQVAIGLKYDYAYSFSYGYAVVFKGQVNEYGSPEEGKYGLIDTSGNPVSQVVWEDADFYNRSGMIAVKAGGKYGFADAFGNPLTAFSWDNAYGFSEGFARVKLDGKWGFIDSEWNILARPVYDLVQNFSNGCALVFNGTVDDYDWPEKGKYGFMDATGSLISPMQWDDARDFQEGMALVKAGEKYGFINTAGKVVIKPQFLDAGSFFDGLAAVCVSNTFSIPDVTTPDLRKTNWGMTREQVEALEGEPDDTGPVEGTNAEYIGYNTTVMGFETLLGYYFSDEGLFAAAYILDESHGMNDLYIDDYETIEVALTKKYGTPDSDSEDWDTSSHKSSYANRKGDALGYGYLTYTTTYHTERTNITLTMSLDDDKISTSILYSSAFMEIPERDYSGDI